LGRDLKQRWARTLGLGLLLAAHPCLGRAAEAEAASVAWPPADEGFALGAPAWAGETGAAPFKDRAWLQDLYAWKESYAADQEAPPQESGAYCIGNGRAFAMLGPGGALWNWSSLYGASYVAPDLGALAMSLTRDGSEVALPSRGIGWVRRSGVVRARAEGGGLALETYDFAPAGPKLGAWDNPPALVRVVRVMNTGSKLQAQLRLSFKLQPAWAVKHQLSPGAKDLFLEQFPAQGKQRTYWRLGAFDARGASTAKNRVAYDLPALAPGEEAWAAFFLIATESPQENSSLAAALRAQGPLALLDQTRAFFGAWFEQGVEFTGDARLKDLFEVSSVIFKCQQSHSGGFSPLIGYAYTWIRDNNGPIRWFLKTGHPAEAKAPMDFFMASAASRGFLINSVRVDAPLARRRRNLAKIGVEFAETPNWVVLQHVWYAQATGDLAWLRPRWEYLKRCVWGQMNVDDKYFFERDETYLWCLEGRIFSHVPYPNHFLSTFAFTADSSFELAAAAEHLAWLGRALGHDADAAALQGLAGRVRAKAVESYWNDQEGYWKPAQSLLGPAYNAPFANILLNPFWCGFARNDLDPVGETPEDGVRSIEGLRSGYRFLGRKDGVWKSTPNVDFFVGMNPGQLLYSLCKARLPWAGSAFDWTLKAASPSGDYSEIYDGHSHPWNPPALGQGTRGRVRPWEGGLNADALLEYLTGFSPDAPHKRVVFAPHLPEGMDAFGARHLPVGGARLSLDLKRTDRGHWESTLVHEEGEAVQVTMDFWAAGRVLSGVQTQGEVAWNLSPTVAVGRQARCSFYLVPGQKISFEVSEGPALPARELNPPAPATFKPKPYAVDAGDLLLMTSPSALLNPHGYGPVPAARFLPLGGSELEAMGRVTPAPAFLDLDLPVSAADVAGALVTKEGKPKFKLVVLGRGAFSPGSHDFKPAAFWEDPKLAQAFKAYLQLGGCLFVGPSFPGREALPAWLARFTPGWTEGESPDKAVPNQEGAASHQWLDAIRVGDLASEEAHGVQVTGGLDSETLSLPDDGGQQNVTLTARTFRGAYAFTLRTRPGSVNRVYFRVDTGRNIKGTSLAILNGGHWVPLGVRTKDGASPRQFQYLSIEVPAALATDEVSQFRLTSRNGDVINVCSLQSYALAEARDPALARLLGFSPGVAAGEVDHGLLPAAKNWAAPLVLSGKAGEAALILCRVGKGSLFRSELSLTDSEKLLKILLKPGTLERLNTLMPR
jgi:hypothetical protein